jgi:hypothetical protein
VAAVRSAKAYKYAYEAQDAAQQWADFFLGGLDFGGQAGCGALIKIPTKDDPIKKAFDPFTNAPDELIPGGMNYESLPCPAKGCKGCKGPNCKNKSDNEDNNDNNNPSLTNGQPPEKTENSQIEHTSESPPTTTTTSTSSSTSSAFSTSTLDCKALAERSSTKQNTFLSGRLLLASSLR